MKTPLVLLVFASLVTAVEAQPASTSELVLPRLLPALSMSAETRLAVRVAAEAAVDSQAAPIVATSAASAPPEKSPGRAFLMSLLVPGTGELWAGATVRAAVFFGLEVIAQGTRFSWKGKGNDLKDEFRARADTTWNPWNYLGWRDSRNARFSSITHALPCSSYVVANPSSRDRDPDAVPDAISDCPGSEKQQYYELIGKYDQFISGWEDVIDRDSNRVNPTDVDSAENFQSDVRLTYEDDRNESNKFLKRASTVRGLLLVNHVFSAIDAARVARARNLGQDEAVIDRRTRFGLALGGSSGTTPLLMAYRPFDGW